MRRRDFTIGLLPASATGVQAQERAKQHRIAIVIPVGPVALIDDTGGRFYQAFWEELRRSGDVEGQNLIVERYSAEGRHEGYGDPARQVVSRNPDVIVAVTDAIALAVRAVTVTTPIVWIGGDAILAGFTTSLARPGRQHHRRHRLRGDRDLGQAPADPRGGRPVGIQGCVADHAHVARSRRTASRRSAPATADLGDRHGLQASTPSEVERLFADIVQERLDAIMVNPHGDLLAHRRLIVELVEKSGLPAMYPWREYVEAGGLMAYEANLIELFRGMADDVHQILNGAKPGDIPIYLPTKYLFVINLKAAKAIGLTVPPALLAAADEVIE